MQAGKGGLSYLPMNSRLMAGPMGGPMGAIASPSELAARLNPPLQGPAMMQGPAQMGARPAFRPDMRMGFPSSPTSGAYSMAGAGGGPNPSLRPMQGPIDPRRLPVVPEMGPPRPAHLPRPGSAAAARAMAGQSAGGEVRAATAAMNRPIRPGASPPGWRGLGRPMADPVPPSSGGPGNLGRRGPGGFDPGPGRRGNLPAVIDKKKMPWQTGRTQGFGKTSYGGVSGWARGAHNPFEIARNYGSQVKSTAAGTAGAYKAGYGKIGARIAAQGWGPGTMAFFRAANPAIMTAMVGNLMLGAAGFEEGSKGDIIGEGLMVGAAFGAPWGGVGALVGAPAFMALNVITGGAAANLVQKLPLVGGVFGGTETKEEDARDIAKTMFGNAAATQGLDPAEAEAMSSTFEAYWKMAEAGMIDPSQLLPMIYQTGRQHGLTGFPWESEAMNPAYSAEDIAGITEGVGKALQPLQDVATSMMNMDYSHIQDEATRARLIESSNLVAENIVNGMGSAIQGPATTAMLSESQANTQLGGQLGGVGSFESDLLGAMG